MLNYFGIKSYTLYLIMPISELRQTVRNLRHSSYQLKALASTGSYGTDTLVVYNQLCDVLDDLNNKLMALEGQGEPVDWIRFNPAA